MDNRDAHRRGHVNGSAEVELIDLSESSNTHRSIGAWDLADLFGGAHSAQLTPRDGHQTLLWVSSGEARVTDGGDFAESVCEGETCMVTTAPGASKLELAAATDATGVRLDAALPAGGRGAAGGTVEIFEPDPFTLRSVTTTVSGKANVLVGTMFGRTSPVATYSPLVAVKLLVAPNAEIALTLDPRFEYGLLTTFGAMAVQGVEVQAGTTAYRPAGAKTLGVINLTGQWSRAVLFGGAPAPR